MTRDELLSAIGDALFDPAADNRKFALTMIAEAADHGGMDILAKRLREGVRIFVVNSSDAAEIYSLRREEGDDHESAMSSCFQDIWFNTVAEGAAFAIGASFDAANTCHSSYDDAIAAIKKHAAPTIRLWEDQLIGS